MAQTLQDVIAKDRERLNKERETIFSQQQELEGKLAEINREFAAIEAYEAAKTIADSEAEAHLLHLASVSGIGDEGFAASVSTGGPSYDVNVAKGGAAAEIQVNSVMPVNEQHAERLVALAVARL